MTLLTPLCAGAVAGGGAFVVGRSLRPRPIPLPRALERLTGRGPTVAGDSAPSGRRTVIALAERIGRPESPALARDLAVTGRQPIRHATDKLTMALVVAAACAGFAVIGPMSGIPVTPLIALVLVVAGAAVGFLLPDWSLKRDAKRKRRDFCHALSGFLDLVNVGLAGGAGLETALHAAANSGDGWAFDEIRHALERARTTRRSTWSALADMGDSLGVADLAELSASVQLAGEQGARIAASLSAKAQAMRAQQLARIEADANAASERMGLPTVLLFAGFLALLAYPAVQIILASG
jgi:Flp pilus assembly protein TadB